MINNEKPKESNMIVENAMADLEQELCPANQNIAKIKPVKRTRAPKSATKAEEVPNAEVVDFEGIDTFKNCNTFIQFYRHQLRSIDKNVKFYEDYRFDRQYALEILDLLITNNRDNNKFVKEWIKYFDFMNLKGRNVMNTEKTSLQNFKSTFETFNSKYVGN